VIDATVDAHEVLARAQRVLERGPQPGDVAPLANAGELLPDWYDEWLLFERERFQLNASAVGGTQQSRGAETVASGLIGRTALSLGHAHALMDQFGGKLVRGGPASQIGAGGA
jgi:hypothetical protein